MVVSILVTVRVVISIVGCWLLCGLYSGERALMRLGEGLGIVTS